MKFGLEINIDEIFCTFRYSRLICKNLTNVESRWTTQVGISPRKCYPFSLSTRHSAVPTIAIMLPSFFLLKIKFMIILNKFAHFLRKRKVKQRRVNEWIVMNNGRHEGTIFLPAGAHSGDGWQEGIKFELSRIFNWREDGTTTTTTSKETKTKASIVVVLGFNNIHFRQIKLTAQSKTGWREHKWWCGIFSSWTVDETFNKSNKLLLIKQAPIQANCVQF